jgi:hypothetical protein
MSAMTITSYRVNQDRLEFCLRSVMVEFGLKTLKFAASDDTQAPATLEFEEFTATDEVSAS